MTANVSADMQVYDLPPQKIKATDNVRYALKATRIDSLAEDIAHNGIMVPIEVEPLSEPDPEQPDAEYRLTLGHYRYAAVIKLNKDGAGMNIPAIIRPQGYASPAERIKRQLKENSERENMTPMDEAVAIRKLLDGGVSRVEIREIFSRPGGRKGMKNQAVSNSFLNMRTSFLEFPRDIQTKLHDGRLTVQAAYRLTRAPQDRWKQIMEDAEKNRIAAIEQEEKDEANFLLQEDKVKEARAKEDEVIKELETAKSKLQDVSVAADRAAEVEMERLKALRQGAKDDAEKQQREADYKAAQEAQKAATRIADEARKVTEKLEVKAKSAAEMVADRAAKLAVARNEAKARAKSSSKKVGAGDIEKAISPAKGTPLTAIQMREIINDWAVAGSSYPKVREIAKVILNCFSGAPGCLTDRQAYMRIAIITGEKPEKVEKVVAEKPGKKAIKEDKEKAS